MEHGGDAGTILALMEALEGSWLGTLARSSRWLYPLASVLHVLGLAFLLGTIAVFDLRVLGMASRLPLEACAGFLLPVAQSAFAVQVVTGVVMFSADADHIYDNPFFLLKIALIAAALANIAFFHRKLRADPTFYERGIMPRWAKAGAAASLILWIAVAASGRMIAYV